MSAVSDASPSLPAGSSTEPIWKKRRIAQSGLCGEGMKTVRMPATLVGVLAFVVAVVGLGMASSGAATARRGEQQRGDSSMSGFHLPALSVTTVRFAGWK